MIRLNRGQSYYARPVRNPVGVQANELRDYLRLCQDRTARHQGRAVYRFSDPEPGPSAIVCYSAGGFGGVRAAMQLRMTLSELGMPSIPSILPFARVGSAFSEDGIPQDPAVALPTARFLNELEWYARALQAERGMGTPY
jgi:NAD(P)H-dependent FMN reductase